MDAIRSPSHLSFADGVKKINWQKKKRKMNIYSALKILEDFEKVICDHEREFLNKFCYGADYLTEIAFTSSSVKTNFILSSGQHVVNSHKLDEIIEFVNSF